MTEYNVTVRLSPIAVEVLEQLFINGPTWDGDVVSKSGRDELFDLKLAGRYEGYQWLTLEGIKLALANKVDRKKETRYRRQRERLAKLDQVEEIFIPRDGYGVAENKAQARSTVQGLEKLLEPEREDGRV